MAIRDGFSAPSKKYSVKFDRIFNKKKEGVKVSDHYEMQIGDLKDELEVANREIDKLKADNKLVREENAMNLAMLDCDTFTKNIFVDQTIKLIEWFACGKTYAVRDIRNPKGHTDACYLGQSKAQEFLKSFKIKNKL